MSENKTVYRQCKMVQNNLQLTVWIPAYGAKAGNSMILEGKTGRWTVKEVYSSMTRSELDNQRSAQKRWDDVIK